MQTLKTSTTKWSNSTTKLLETPTRAEVEPGKLTLVAGAEEGELQEVAKEDRNRTVVFSNLNQY